MFNKEILELLLMLKTAQKLPYFVYESLVVREFIVKSLGGCMDYTDVTLMAKDEKNVISEIKVT